jgi:hypothetical protein
MGIFSALFSTAFLILVAASIAVTGSMIVLTLFDRAFGRKKKPASSVAKVGAIEDEAELRDPAHANQI